MSYIQQHRLAVLDQMIGSFGWNMRTEMKNGFTVFVPDASATVQVEVRYLPLMGGAVELVYGRDGDTLRRCLGHSIQCAMPRVGPFSWLSGMCAHLAEKFNGNVQAIWPANMHPYVVCGEGSEETAVTYINEGVVIAGPLEPRVRQALQWPDLTTPDGRAREIIRLMNEIAALGGANPDTADNLRLVAAVAGLKVPEFPTLQELRAIVGAWERSK